jgi:hypothetical protein
MDRLGVDNYSVNRNSNGVFWATYTYGHTDYGDNWSGTDIISKKFGFGNGSSNGDSPYQNWFENEGKHKYYNNFTFEDAIWHYRLGNGQPVDININQLNLSNVTVRSFRNAENTLEGNPRIILNLFSKSNITQQGLIHGNVEIVYLGNNSVMIKPNEYNFDWFIPSGFNSRNFFTSVGAFWNGGGTSFWIQYNGIYKIKN